MQKDMTFRFYPNLFILLSKNAIHTYNNLFRDEQVIIQVNYSQKTISSDTRGGLAIRRTGRIPGGLAANLARCPAFFFIFYNLLLLFYIVVVVFVAYRMY